MTIPRILIAGAQSGSGKTSLSLAVVAALRRRSLRVQTFKVGPDFLDPTYLAAASGRACYNLDGWMCGRPYVESLFQRAAQDADLAVIEGVMGLFDGADPCGQAGSSAEIAGWLKAPVLLVVNAHGMARSFAALVSGFTGFERIVHIGGVVANFCGSETHKAVLEEALASAGLPPLIGAFPRNGLPEMRSRHLGLVTADPSENCTPAVLDSFAEAAERHLSLDGLLLVARKAPALETSFQNKGNAVSGRIRLGVARDEAFHFYYQDLFDELSRRGCAIEWFSPVRGKGLPGGLDGLYLGGGYPEEFAAGLSANQSMLDSIRRFAQSGRPVYAECGGLIYLSRSVTTREGNRFPLLGILPCDTRLLDHKKRLGYVEVVLKQDSLWGGAGEVLRGHEFHYSEQLSDPADQRPWTAAYHLRTRNGGCSAAEGFQRGRILASYVHLHLAGHPRALDRFIEVCASARTDNPPYASKETSA
ncbi:MAG: cobyrinate a,c-diamide synthase [Syntrophaceae bacterium]